MASTTPNFIRPVTTDAGGLRDEGSLPITLPYHLRSNQVLRLVEDLHQLLHDLNTQLVEKGYERLEELLDSAGFSGLVSRAVVDRIARQSNGRMAANAYHNGYPDLLPYGVYAHDRVQHGERGGLEVKASRYEGGWQSHGPRAGWFCVVQFAIDRDVEKAIQDRDPTKILAVMIAELEKDDWSWQPAKEGRIRSGTASVKATGAKKLRAGAVWVDPTYEKRHQQLLADMRLKTLGQSRVPLVAEALLTTPDEPMKTAEIAAEIATQEGIENPESLHGHVRQALTTLIAEGKVVRVRPGVFKLVSP